MAHSGCVTRGESAKYPCTLNAPCLGTHSNTHIHRHVHIIYAFLTFGRLLALVFLRGIDLTARARVYTAPYARARGRELRLGNPILRPRAGVREAYRRPSLSVFLLSLNSLLEIIDYRGRAYTGRAGVAVFPIVVEVVVHIFRG